MSGDIHGSLHGYDHCGAIHMIGHNNVHTACAGKESFERRQAAERVARAMNAPKRIHNRKNSWHAPAHVYKCEFCHKYHITGRKRTKIEIKEL